MSAQSGIRCVLVDPSLFTGPYDAALTHGLVAAGARPLWATRPTRHGDAQEIPSQYVDAMFYKGVDDVRQPALLRSLSKGLSHLYGLLRLLMLINREKPDVVHVQWVVLPLIDTVALWLIRLRRPLIITVHDPVPYNGQRLSTLQNLGFDLPIRLADRVIVHTQAGRETLLRRGIPGDRIQVIPHGPLRLRAEPKQSAAAVRESRWTFVMFGEIKPYKGLDVLVAALALLPNDVRNRVRVIVAGRPRMPLEHIIAEIARLELQDSIELRTRRLSDQEMADLFAETDCFVFPYRQIDASGVYFLTQSLGKWLIASRVGVFAENIREGVHGDLFAAGDCAELAAKLTAAIGKHPAAPLRPSSDEWKSIGSMTEALYRQAVAAHD